MKLKTKLIVAFVIAVLAIVSCVTQVNAQTNDVDLTALILDTAAKVNTMTAPVNPYVAPISAFIAFVGIIVGWFRKSKAEKHLAVVVKGVEAINDKATKESIEQEAIKAGAHAAVDVAVQKILG